MSILDIRSHRSLQPASYSRTVRPVQIRALLDVIPHPTAIFDTMSRLLYTNTRLKALLQHDPQSSSVLSQLEQLGHTTALTRADQHTDVTTCASAYRARATFLDMQLIGNGETVVLSLEPAPDVLPSGTQLQCDFGLTAREAKVALLLAQRARTDEIAEDLGISKNTVRRHIERVLAKLQISTRTDVRCRILGVYRST